MIRQNKKNRTYAVVAALAASLWFAGPAPAAQADVELLKSYIGAWKGRGTTTSAGSTETVVCKLDITSSAATKVKYSGRCTLAGGGLTIAGTMAFIEERDRFEAVMSSNTSFSGVAIGKRRGRGGLEFQLKERDADTGADYSIDAGIALKNGNIEIDFSITEVESGKKILAVVPFEK